MRIEEEIVDSKDEVDRMMLKALEWLYFQSAKFAISASIWIGVDPDMM